MFILKNSGIQNDIRVHLGYGVILRSFINNMSKIQKYKSMIQTEIIISFCTCLNLLLHFLSFFTNCTNKKA